MTDLLIRIAIYVPILFLIAVVVVGQFHVTVRETLKDAVRRTGRWLLYTAVLVAVMFAFTWLFID